MAPQALIALRLEWTRGASSAARIVYWAEPQRLGQIWVAWEVVSLGSSDLGKVPNNLKHVKGFHYIIVLF